ncbi:TetR/AcrR family transcriptional regulator (plasmid) [Rhizobium indigoferae]|uniref:TetR/AcrR family transcriptional regulator n=2 Tax=Rhizobium indigoferae TaxID=158891 RepID=A0ABZ1DTG9_9HYPH|nr:TetR/AcrR family transcriptional regulator [Rhizobium indigoferae]WRW39291.1 TetR/AcrR family transcriptional regulator [Rhizobium indigoferae]
MHNNVLTSPPSSPSPRAPRGRPREFDRQVALATATRLFWIKGYEATSVVDLTEAMGIGTKSLYAAFGSKDELYAEALKYYYTSYEGLVWTRFRKASTAREAALAFLQDSAIAMTGGDSDLPHGCMATLATVGSEGHSELAELMRATRAGGFDLLKTRFDTAKSDGDLEPTTDTTKLARFVQIVQSGMAIRARDGADRAELHAAAEFALSGWDNITGTIDQSMQIKG